MRDRRQLAGRQGGLEPPECLAAGFSYVSNLDGEAASWDHSGPGQEAAAAEEFAASPSSVQRNLRAPARALNRRSPRRNYRAKATACAFATSPEDGAKQQEREAPSPPSSPRPFAESRPTKNNLPPGTEPNENQASLGSSDPLKPVGIWIRVSTEDQPKGRALNITRSAPECMPKPRVGESRGLPPRRRERKSVVSIPKPGGCSSTSLQAISRA